MHTAAHGPPSSISSQTTPARICLFALARWSWVVDLELLLLGDRRQVGIAVVRRPVHHLQETGEHVGGLAGLHNGLMSRCWLPHATLLRGYLPIDHPAAPLDIGVMVSNSDGAARFTERGARTVDAVYKPPSGNSDIQQLPAIYWLWAHPAGPVVRAPSTHFANHTTQPRRRRPRTHSERPVGRISTRE